MSDNAVPKAGLENEAPGVQQQLGRRLFTRFRTKFILVASLSVLVALLLSGAVALWSVQRLGQDASAKVQLGLKDASREYLDNYIQTTAQRTNLTLDRALSELQTLASFSQYLIDHPDDAGKLGETVNSLPGFEDKLTYNQAGHWQQNGPNEPAVVSVWGTMLEADGTIKPEVRQHVQQTAILDWVLPPMKTNGAAKLYFYYVGPRGMSYLRLSPYTDMAREFDRLYPGHNKSDFWDFFFPGIVDGWEAKAKTNPGKVPATLTPPYEDAAGGGTIVSAFYPLWDSTRQKFAGAAAMDFSLAQIVALIEDVKLAKTGFAFLAQPNGNVLAVNGAGQKTLGLSDSTTSEGAAVLERSLGKSSQPAISKLSLPTDDSEHFDRLVLNERGTERPYVLVTKRLRPLEQWVDKTGIQTNQWTLGFLVPEDEIYAPLIAATKDIERTTKTIWTSQFAIALLALAIVLAAVMWVSKRMTAGLILLADAANQIKEKEYGVRVPALTNDEIGQLAVTFNIMASDIQNYTSNLEGMVKDRTRALEGANQEITKLNEMLKEENVRLGAEIDIARRLQLMVLPKTEELRGVPLLDIAGYMEPATEVGGDYYDVLQHGSRVKIGIGDVTGHGLESGVLMLMVQSVARTLLESGENDPVRFLNVVNQVICKNLARAESTNNLTLSFADYTDGTVTLTGQHEEVIVIRQDGSVERIDTMDLGFPVGLESEISHFIQSRAVPLTTGDLMIFYTDGVTEAVSPDGEMFGVERLCEAASRYRAGTATEIKQGIIRDVMSHIDTQRIHDDITLVVLKHR
jgi:phosphoserine phosphatase RsbU/P